MPIDPNSPPPTVRTVNWLAEVTKAWQGKYYAADVCYQFSNGRKFLSTDGSHGGAYANSPQSDDDLVWP